MGALLAYSFHIVSIHGYATYRKNYHSTSKTYGTAPRGPSLNFFRIKWQRRDNPYLIVWAVFPHSRVQGHLYT